MPDEPLFQSLDASKLQGNLLHLLCRTAREKGRIEITNCDGGTCILMSKEELDDLEAALEILSNTDGGRKLHHTVQEYVQLDDGDESVPHLAVVSIISE